MQTLNTIEPGWDVLGSDDQKIGTVSEVGSGYVLLKKGLIFPKDIFVPDAAITASDPARKCVTINVTKDQVDSMGWTAPPEVPLPPIGGTTTTDAGQTFTLPPGQMEETVGETRTTAERNAASTGWEGATEVVQDDFEREELRRKEAEGIQPRPPAR